MPTWVLSSATVVVATSWPATSIVPRTSAGTACGIRPFIARVSVDLPDPLGPEQQHDLARLDVEARRGGGGRILARVGDRQIAHPQQRDAARPRAARGSHARQGCLCRGGRIALECGHGSSQERS